MADQRARQLRKTMTPQEVKAWARLRQLRPQGLHFRRQAPLMGYILDFVCFDRRLIVEIDGSQHGIGGQIRHDEQRDAAFATEGFLTLRFWNNEIDRDLNGVIDTIFARATERDPTRVVPHPAASQPPSPERGGAPHPAAARPPSP